VKPSNERADRRAIRVRYLAELDSAIKTWDPKQREGFELNTVRVSQDYERGEMDTGIRAAELLLKRQTDRLGEAHIDTARVRVSRRGARARGARQ
jgi:hypothetical protein